MPKNERHKRLKVKDEQLEKLILSELNRIVKLRADTGEIRSEGRMALEERLEEEERVLSSLEDWLVGIEAEKKAAYEDYRLQDGDRDKYLAKKEQLEASAAEIKESIKRQRAVIGDMEERVRACSDRFGEVMDGISSEDDGGVSFNKLTEEMVERLLEKVIVFEDCRMEIVWRFGKGG